MSAELEPAFGRLLREWRSRRRVSQLGLSFIETGRAQPSREMVLILARVGQSGFASSLVTTSTIPALF